MQVKDRMTPDPVTVADEASFEEALHLLKEKKIRRLPVVSKDGRLTGIVVEKDLLTASPSRATTLSVFEMHCLLLKLRVRDVMTKRVFAVADDCPLEEAARIMVERKIGCLIVTRAGRLAGIITETDIFKTFAEMLGGGQNVLRLTLDVTEGKGVLAAIAGEIVRNGGNILTLATFFGTDEGERIITVKVTDVAKEPLLKGLEATGVRILDAIDITGGGYAPQVVDGKSRPFVTA